MRVAVVAPWPVPYMFGGAEVLWRGLVDHINEATEHDAELVGIDSREHEFFELVETYRRFSELDLKAFDVVVSSKYPTWMAEHPRHVVYMLHKLRGLFDTYHFLGMPERLENAPADARAIQDLMAANPRSREVLPELFERLLALRGAPPEVTAFPGPFIREVLHFLDDVGLAPDAIRRFGAISHTVAAREDYFPEGAAVFVAHPPTALEGLRGGRGSYLFTASRLENPKRVALLIEAMAHVRRPVELRIAGTGPDEEHLRALAARDERISFLGQVDERRLVDLYAGARAVAFLPYQEDYGLVTVEAMVAGKPVITTTDSGGPTELVDHGVNGLVVEPTAEALGAAIDSMWSLRGRLASRRRGRAARERAARITWDAVVEPLLA